MMLLSSSSVFQFFNNALVVGKSSESEVAEHLYDLILELHAIDSSVLLSVLPQLEFKLKVNERKYFIYNIVAVKVSTCTCIIHMYKCICLVIMCSLHTCALNSS